MAFPLRAVLSVLVMLLIACRYSRRSSQAPAPLSPEKALQRNTPRASSVAFLLRRQPRSKPVALDLSHHPQAQSLEVRPHDLETYDELARTKDDDNDEQ